LPSEYLWSVPVDEAASIAATEGRKFNINGIRGPNGLLFYR
jgi:hypothetical protein